MGHIIIVFKSIFYTCGSFEMCLTHQSHDKNNILNIFDQTIDIHYVIPSDKITFADGVNTLKILCYKLIIQIYSTSLVSF